MNAKFLVAAGLLAMLAACGGNGSDDENEQLSQARQQWSKAAVVSYQYGLNKSCACAADSPGVGSFVIVVNGSTVVSATDASSGDPVPEDQLAELPTVDDLFEIVSYAYDGDADVVDVDYESEYGYPKAITIDPDKGAADDESAYLVTDFTPAPSL